MERFIVRSSNIRSIGYDRWSEILEIEFLSGGIYQYRAVPPALHRELMEAESHGRFFAAFIRGKFSFWRL
ncbi:KTSC domain-containing protein [Kitasatospora sp. NBC_01302]|uniref:KTSC domain-containing protein n=1 Tax=Kitasatospora sp. NBC_01302 TaxID=2903575 RepID=UPI003FA36615